MDSSYTRTGLSVLSNDGSDAVSAYRTSIRNLATWAEANAALRGQGLLASRPAAGKAGTFYKATDDTAGILYYDNGTTWETLGAAPPTDGSAATPSLRTLGSGSQQAAAGNHSHGTGSAYVSDTPAMHGFKDWTFEPLLANSTSGTATAGIVYLMRVDAQSAGVVTNVVVNLSTAGVTLTGCYVGVYDVVTGNRLGVSADQSTTWAGSTGTKTVALASPTSSITVGQKLWLALLVGTAGTAPQFWRNNQAPSMATVGQTTSSPYQFANYVTTGQTTLPATITTANTVTTSTLCFWAATS